MPPCGARRYNIYKLIGSLATIRWSFSQILLQWQYVIPLMFTIRSLLSFFFPQNSTSVDLFFVVILFSPCYISQPTIPLRKKNITSCSLSWPACIILRPDLLCVLNISLELWKHGAASFIYSTQQPVDTWRKYRLAFKCFQPQWRIIVGHSWGSSHGLILQMH